MKDETRRVMPYKARPNNTRDVRSDVLVAMFVPSKTKSFTTREIQRVAGEPLISITAIRDHLNSMCRAWSQWDDPWVEVVPGEGRSKLYRLTSAGREVAKTRKRRRGGWWVVTAPRPETGAAMEAAQKREEADRLGYLSDRIAKGETLSPGRAVVLDLGDEAGYWIGCCGHVDRYDFVCALDELGAGTEVSAKGPHPTHAFMVRFADPGDEDEVWWQLDGWHPEAVSVEPVTVLALRADEGDCEIPKRAGNPRSKAGTDV